MITMACAYDINFNRGEAFYRKRNSATLVEINFLFPSQSYVYDVMI